MTNKNKLFLKIAGLSLLLFLITCWTAWIHFSIAGIVEGLSFMVFAWWCCRMYKPYDVSYLLIGLAIVTGRIILEIPIRLFDWFGSIISLPVLAICLISIFLGLLCYSKKNAFLWILCIAIIVASSLFSYSSIFDIL